jgi:hypothetical protein
VAAIDPESQPLSYRVLAGTIGAGVFDVNATSGALFLLPGNVLDFETVRSYQVNVEVLY